jgi:signal transduction histidine kinase
MSTNPNNPTPDDSNNPAPEKKTVRPPGVLDARDPSSGPIGADQLTILAHDLSNMLDGSMRWLGLAAAALPEEDRARDLENLTSAREQINTVLSTLERMSSMVNAAMRSKSVPIGSPLLGVSSVVTIAMVIDHAVDVVRPLASQAGVRIEVRIDPRAGRLPAGPMYTVALNALFNAVQSIAKATKPDSLDPGGLIEIIARVDTKREETVIEIFDDGVGLDTSVRNNRAFKHGVSTNADHQGIGLSMAHQIVEQLEGIITLTPRDERAGSARPGAVLRVCIPSIYEPDEETNIGDLEIG